MVGATASSSRCRPIHQTATSRDRSGLRSMAAANPVDEGGDLGVGGDTAPAKVREQLGVRELENPLKARDFRLPEPRELRVDERLKHGVELAHPPPTPPPKSLDVRSPQDRKSTRLNS